MRMTAEPLFLAPRHDGCAPPDAKLLIAGYPYETPRFTIGKGHPWSHVCLVVLTYCAPKQPFWQQLIRREHLTMRAARY